MDHYHQQIPRPADAARLEKTSWSELSLARALTTKQVLGAFAGDQLGSVDVEGVGASVLVGIVDRSGAPHLVLTRRALDLERDPGLIALPGGYVEADEDPLSAVLREADEEIGLRAGDVQITSCLGVFARSRTGLRVAAYLGLVDSSCRLSPSVDEVHEIFEVPLATLYRAGSAWQEEWRTAEEVRVIHFFADAGTLGDNLVWGLTAAIIWRLLEGVAESITDPSH